MISCCRNELDISMTPPSTPLYCPTGPSTYSNQNLLLVSTGLSRSRFRLWLDFRSHGFSCATLEFGWHGGLCPITGCSREISFFIFIPGISSPFLLFRGCRDMLPGQRDAIFWP